MKIEQEEKKQTIFLRPSGALTAETAYDLLSLLQKGLQAQKVIIIELGQVDVCDTYGAQLLISAGRTKTAGGRHIQLTGMPEHVREFFWRIGFENE